MRSELKILEPNKTVVFYSPIEGEDVLVRTGAVNDKCNFFHALLHSYSSDYVNMNANERIKFVKQLRASMAGLIDINNWKNNYMLSQKIYLLNLEHLYQELYFWLENPALTPSEDISTVVGEISKKLDMYILISKLLPMDTVLNKVISEINETVTNESANSLSKVVLKNIMIEFNTHPKLMKAKPEKSQYLSKKLQNIVQIISQKAISMGFNRYIQDLENDDEALNEFSYDFAQNRFNRNIVVIGTDRLPIKLYSKTGKEKRKTIFMIKLTNNHYEILGRLLPDNYVQREFDFNDTLVLNVKKYFSGEKLPASPERSEESIIESDKDVITSDSEPEVEDVTDMVENGFFDSEDENEALVVPSENL